MAEGNDAFRTDDHLTGSNTMKFILMMHAPHGSGDYQVASWSQQDLEAHIRFMHELNRELTEAGELAGGKGLAPPAEARIVRADDTGKPLISDGPFPESKEFLAGYWMVDVDSAERAYQIAAKVSTAPGPGGAPLNMAIEVRQVMSAPIEV